MTYLRHPATAVWALLVGATVTAWFIGEGDSHLAASVAVIVIALVKIRFIVMNFMEIGHAPRVWRLIFEAWLVIVGVAMIGLYLAGAPG